MAEQTLFSRAVGFHLPSAIPVQLERVDQFAVGKVLIYHKKPHRLLPWRKHELNFTGYSLPDLLVKGSSLKFATASNFLFDVGKGVETVDTKMGLDAELKEALVKLNLRFQGKREKQTTITTDFGKITYTSTDLYHVMQEKSYSLDTSNPIVREAIAKGGTIFVISTLYEAEHSKISVKVTENESETTRAGLQPHGSGGDGDENVTHLETNLQVTNRDIPTPVAFLLLKLTIGSRGELRPKLRSGLGHSTKTDIDWVTGSYEAGSLLPTTLAGTRIDPADSIDFQEWVMVDVAREKDPKSDVSAKSKAPKDSTEKPPTAAETASPPLEQAERKLVPSLQVTPPAVAKPESKGKVELPFDIPVQPPPTEATDDPQLDYYTHGLKDFQAFASSTYEGILTEINKLLEPLLANPDLQKVFLEFTKPPNTYQNLQKLTEYLEQLGDALHTHSVPSPNKDAALNPILQALSSSWGTQLDQITALILAAEGCSELPQHTLQKMFALDQEKRTTVLNLIKGTPYGTSRHLFLDEGPFKDPVLYPILNKIGYSCPDNKHLLFSASDDTESDILAAASIVIMIAPPLPSST